MSETVQRLALRPCEAAQAIGVCEKTVRDLIKGGKLRAARVDRAILIPVGELQRFLADRAGASLAESEAR